MNTLLTHPTHSAHILPSPLPFAGNGVLASRRIAKGALVFSERPVLSVLKHPRECRCLECWRPTQHAFCANHQASLLNKAMARMHSQQGFTALRETQLRRLAESTGKEGGFAIMISDLVALSLMDLLTAGNMNRSSNLVAGLVKGKEMPPQGIPEEWKSQYDEIKTVMLTGKGLSDLFSLTWYCDQMTRLNLNAMQTWFPASREGKKEPVVGTALYLFASMLNHSCVPNVRVDWVDDNVIRVIAEKDIEAGEELNISYIGEVDATQEDPVVLKERWEFFRFNYGFHRAFTLEVAVPVELI
ncbi:hypothetical protein HDU98_011982 [Podochytrium sp. JEL0797]|nr:hypothetical protein HDU98_011982 [Podochytrium sp. JEL0797]